MVSAQVTAAAVATIVTTVAILWRSARQRGQAWAASRKDVTESESHADIPENVRRHFVFWGGLISGILSAAVTHGLDVLKVTRHVGRGRPETWHEFFFGMSMGSIAQGQRFAVTLLLDATLQKKLDSWEKKSAKKNGTGTRLVSFLLSMFAAGAGEFLSNPPVVVKNYQIANQVTASTACIELWQEDGLPRFFSGVAMGVVRKSLANAIVLQTIGYTKQLVSGSVQAVILDPTQQKVVLGFLAGSLNGGLAEVLTNHPDQVKTLTQTGMGFWEAMFRATRNPFRGAGWAGLRKGIIRGINWGCLALCIACFEHVFRAIATVRRRPDPELEGEA